MQPLVIGRRTGSNTSSAMGRRRAHTLCGQAGKPAGCVQPALPCTCRVLASWDSSRADTYASCGSCASRARLAAAWAPACAVGRVQCGCNEQVLQCGGSVCCRGIQSTQQCT